MPKKLKRKNPYQKQSTTHMEAPPTTKRRKVTSNKTSLSHNKTPLQLYFPSMRLTPPHSTLPQQSEHGSAIFPRHYLAASYALLTLFINDVKHNFFDIYQQYQSFFSVMLNNLYILNDSVVPQGCPTYKALLTYIDTVYSFFNSHVNYIMTICQSIERAQRILLRNNQKQDNEAIQALSKLAARRRLVQSKKYLKELLLHTQDNLTTLMSTLWCFKHKNYHVSLEENEYFKIQDKSVSTNTSFCLTYQDFYKDCYYKSESKFLTRTEEKENLTKIRILFLRQNNRQTIVTNQQFTALSKILSYSPGPRSRTPSIPSPTLSVCDDTTSANRPSNHSCAASSKKTVKQKSQYRYRYGIFPQTSQPNKHPIKHAKKISPKLAPPPLII